MIFLGIVLLIGGMALSVGAPSEAREARLLAERGVDTTAIITELSVRGGGRQSSPYAVVDVEFQGELGLSAQSPGIIYCGEPEEISVGDEVEITYDPEEVAHTQFTECPQSQEITIPLIIGIAVLAAGTSCVLWAWKGRGWKRRWLGIPPLILGVLFVGTSFQDDGQYAELIYTGSALIIIGAAPLVAPRRRAAIAGPTPLGPGPGTSR